MRHMDSLVNRVAQSSLITIKLEDFYPKHRVEVFDVKDYLFHGLILKEMDYREALKNHDWSKYQDCYLTIHCSTDAIIPTWAYMLVASYASGIARDLYFGDPDAFLITYFREQIRALPMESYIGAKVVIKGCSDLQIPASAYLELTHKLKPHASSIMFGEPCSTVPVYKKPKS